MADTLGKPAHAFERTRSVAQWRMLLAELPSYVQPLATDADRDEYVEACAQVLRECPNKQALAEMPADWSRAAVERRDRDIAVLNLQTSRTLWRRVRGVRL